MYNQLEEVADTPENSGFIGGHVASIQFLKLNYTLLEVEGRKLSRLHEFIFESMPNPKTLLPLITTGDKEGKRVGGECHKNHSSGLVKPSRHSINKTFFFLFKAETFHT